MANLRYTMGFKIGNTAIPDPYGFSGAESELDTLNDRDAAGGLHYSKVATKHPLKMEYRNIPWSTILTIGALLASDKFQFTYPSPFTGTTSTIYAHAKDRNFDAVWTPQNKDWLGNLSFSIEEY